MRKILLACAAAAAAVAPAAPASAAEIFHYSFTANTAGPIGAHNGTFSVSLDSGVYSLTAISFSLGSISYDLTNAAAVNWGSSGFVVGDTLRGASAMLAGTNDFNLAFNPTNSFGFFTYSQVGETRNFQVTTDSGFSISAISAVPEPSTWAMMLVGFGGVGFAMRRAKKADRKLAIAAA